MHTFPPPSCFTVIFQTLTFGDYRRASLAERVSITLSTVGAVGWKASCIFRSMRRGWSKAGVVIVSPFVAWVLRSVIFYLYRQAALVVVVVVIMVVVVKRGIGRGWWWWKWGG